MLRKNRILISTVVILTFAFFVISIIGFNLIKANAELTVTGLNEEYFVGEEIKIPQGEFSLDDGTKISATGKVFAPDGNLLTGSKITLKDYGEYTVEYTADYKSVKYSENVKFKAVKPLFEIKGQGESVYSGCGDLGVDGLKVSLTDGSTIKYNKKLDIAMATKNNPLVTFFITPKELGFNDFSEIKVKFTDAYNPDIYITVATRNIETITSRDNKTRSVSNCTISTPNKVCFNDQYLSSWSQGVSNPISFYGTPSSNSIKDNKLSLSYDFLSDIFYTVSGSGSYSTLLNLNAFEEWQGFKSGEVYMEITCSQVCGFKANFVISDIFGQDISYKKLEDTTAPEITVDYGDYSKNDYPNAVVNFGYPVFSATAFDKNDGETPVSTLVYYNYYSGDKVSVSLIDGKFIPKRVGIYTVEYKAKDKFGNIATETVNITVKDSPTPVVASLIGGGEMSINVGSFTDIKTVSASGGEGLLKISATASIDGTPVEITDGKIKPKKCGTCTVNYTVTDYIGQVKTLSYGVTVQNADSPVFTENIDERLQALFLKGYTYSLPKINALTFNADGSVTEVESTVSVDNGNITGNTYVPDSVGTVNITYSATANGKTTSVKVSREIYSIKSSEGYIDFNRMFVVGENIIPSYSSDGNAYYKFETDSSMLFVNELLADKFSFSLSIDKNFNKFHKITFTLTDVENPTVKADITLNRVDDTVVVTVNDGEGIASGVDIYKDNDISVVFSSYAKTIEVNGSVMDLGKYFTPFNAGNKVKVLMSVSGVDESVGFGLSVKKMGNQTLRQDVAIDGIKPELVCVGDFGGNYKINSSYKTPLIVANDVISPELKSFTMTIKTPDGEFLNIDGRSINNIPVERLEFTLSSYGRYNLTYTAEDYSKRKEEITFSIHVLDSEGPSVQIEKGRVVSGTVGTAFNIAEYIASDPTDAAENLNVKILVKDTEGNFSIPKNKTYTPTKEGVYTVYYYVSDLFGNTATAKYTVTVGGAV